MRARRFGLAAIVALLFAAMTRAMAAPADDLDLIAIPGGAFVMGDPEGEPDEVLRAVVVGPFRLMRFEVTNRQFSRFVLESGHRTDPERSGEGFVWTDRWRAVAHADWRHPAGPEATLVGLDDHPVVQVSASDAAAFCAHYSLRLPRDEEWEFAARGLNGRRFPWGNAPPEEQGHRRANFGSLKCCAPDASDGYLRTAPVGRFPSGVSPFGLYDMAGNVWEWTGSRIPGRPEEVALRGGGWGNDAYGLRTSYRHGNPPNIGLDMVGFRCAGERAD